VQLSEKNGSSITPPVEARTPDGKVLLMQQQIASLTKPLDKFGLTRLLWKRICTNYTMDCRILSPIKVFHSAFLWTTDMVA